MTKKYPYKTIEEYIDQSPLIYQDKLRTIQSLIISTIPEAKEIISWGMPTFYYYGNIIHFALNKYHIGLYPGSDCVELFKDDLGQLKYSKGTIQIPFDNDIPESLIKKIVLFRKEENLKNHMNNNKKISVKDI